MTNQEILINATNNNIKIVNSYLHLGHIICYFTKVSTKLKTESYNESILSVSLYVYETWVFNKVTPNKIRVYQRFMERRIQEITLNDHRSDQRIRETTQVDDVTRCICSLKWQWAGHIARRADYIRMENGLKKKKSFSLIEIKKCPGLNVLWIKQLSTTFDLKYFSYFFRGFFDTKQKYIPRYNSFTSVL